jgi:hypothetical protein
MTQYYYYIYVGDNGIIESTVNLPGTPSVKKCRLIADENKLLTKDNKYFTKAIEVPVSEVEFWYEVNKD